MKAKALSNNGAPYIANLAFRVDARLGLHAIHEEAGQ
jgi:hypothetical protein